MHKANILIGLVVTVVLGTLVTSAFAGHVTLTPTNFVATRQASAKPVSGAAIQFDLSAIPAGCHIDLAELDLAATSDTSFGQTVDVDLSAASGSWIGSSGPLTGAIAAVDSLLTGVLVHTGPNQSAQIIATDLVRFWHSGKLPNNGFTISIQGDGTKGFAVAASGGQPVVTLSVFFSK